MFDAHLIFQRRNIIPKRVTLLQTQRGNVFFTNSNRFNLSLVNFNLKIMNVFHKIKSFITCKLFLTREVLVYQIKYFFHVSGIFLIRCLYIHICLVFILGFKMYQDHRILVCLKIPRCIYNSQLERLFNFMQKQSCFSSFIIFLITN